jgi:hypothetical protein
MKILNIAALALIGVLTSGVTQAQPVQLTESQFQQQTAGLTSIIENFDAMPLGTPASPLQLANGKFYGEPQIMNGLWCLLSPCLTVGLTVPPEFTDFPAGTSFWSGRIIYASSGDVLEATIVGGSGTQSFVLPSTGFVTGGTFTGFHDPAGLHSVSFRLIQGQTNYSFDDVSVAIRPNSPETHGVPAQSLFAKLSMSLMLLTIGLLAIGRRRI